MRLDYDEDAEPMVNVATGLHAIARALYALAHGGTSDGPTTLEFIGMQIRDEIAPSLRSIAEALDVAEGLDGED
ncbi:MAG TPA: hypothetical protein VGK73_06740 [Polyangiaceae bacterium]